MSSKRLTRRDIIGKGLTTVAGTVLFVACGQAPATEPGKAAAEPTKAVAVEPTKSVAAEPTKAAATEPTKAAATVATAKPSAQQAAKAEVTVWFHWGAKAGENAQALVDKYNTTQGPQDNVHATIEVVGMDNEQRQKMTAARLAGKTPDFYHTFIGVKELASNDIAVEFPKEEADYVKANYQKGAVDRMTYGGKIWGYPTEHQAAALMYRKSFFKELGLEPPKTSDDVRTFAKQLTKTQGGKKSRFGWTIRYEESQLWVHLPALIARYGGQMYTFEGDKPVNVDVATPEATEAVNWWRSMVDDGSSQIGEMKFEDAWTNGYAAMAEMEPWFPLVAIRDAGKQDIFDDLGVVVVPPKPGLQSVTYANGLLLVGAQGAKNPDLRWKFSAWLMHKPDMPFSHFVVEQIGSIPTPTDYPTDIPGWTKDMIEGYAKQTASIAQANPQLKVLGDGEINNVIAPALQSVLLKKKTPAEALKEINPKLKEILKRTDA